MDGRGRTAVLSRRLQTLCGMVTPGRTVADVGCDHGYADIFLVQQGISPRVLAMDVREGPLAGAREHVEAYGLGDYIEIRLSDGLAAYRAGEAQTLVCAGMGGRLMRRILERGRDKAEGLEELILQPQSELAEFRAFLRAEGYVLLREEALMEGGKYYFPMKAVPGRRADQTARDRQREMFDGLCGRLRSSGASMREGRDGSCAEPGSGQEGRDGLAEPVTELCDAFGMGLLWERNPCLRSYLEAGLGKLLELDRALSRQESSGAGERLLTLGAEITKYRQALALYGS